MIIMAVVVVMVQPLSDSVNEIKVLMIMIFKLSENTVKSNYFFD